MVLFKSTFCTLSKVLPSGTDQRSLIPSGSKGCELKRSQAAHSSDWFITHSGQRRKVTDVKLYDFGGSKLLRV
jgi:hypothetical protein